MSRKQELKFVHKKRNCGGVRKHNMRRQIFGLAQTNHEFVSGKVARMTGTKSAGVVVASCATTRATGCPRLKATFYTAVIQIVANEPMNSGQHGSLKRANGKMNRSPSVTYRNCCCAASWDTVARA